MIDAEVEIAANGLTSQWRVARTELASFLESENPFCDFTCMQQVSLLFISDFRSLRQ
jgi:hypothetical protein